jgi:2-oxoisovalerate dehydrogenase E1 component alpha subunit
VPHSSDDDDRSYRSREEVMIWKKRDPILRFEIYLEEQGLLGAERREEMLEQAMAELDEAIRYAESAPDPDPAEALGPIWGPLPG